jgi:L-fuculose-phosphate aldolase
MKPSSEIKIHIEAYKRRSDIRAFVHAHPPVCTGFAVANIPLNFQTLPEIIISLGSIPLAEYGTPSTTELSNSISELVKCHDAILLANHGAITLGRDLMEAYYKMESVEHFAVISLTAHQLGGMKPISQPNVKKLETIREQFGIKIGGTACMNCGNCSDGTCTARSTKSEYEDIVVEMTNKIMEELKKQQ